MKKSNKIFNTILLLHIIYGLMFVWNTSFVVGGVRYFSLFDDAMISMRYAENMAHGFGAVFNPGQPPVEGYTNPLWMLVMSVFHFVPIGKETISLLFQVFNIVLSAANLFFVDRIINLKFPGAIRIRILALIMVAFYYPLNFWFFMGMEAGAVALIVTATAYLIEKHNEFSYKQLLPLAVGILVRPDVAVCFVAASAYLIYKYRSRAKSIVGWSILFLLITLGGTTIIRYLYYGAILPNTYYLKVEGVDTFYRISRGVFVFVKFAVFFNPIFFAIPFWYFARHRDMFSGFVCGIVSILCLYSMYVGGDAWDWWGGANRFIAPAMPIFFIIIAAGIVQSLPAILNRIKIIGSEKVVFIIISTIIVLNINFLRNASSLEEMFLLRPALGVEDNELNVRMARLARGLAKEDETIAVVTAGVLPYFAERNTIDILGKADPAIARMESRRASGLFSFEPGHTKWNYYHSICTMKPDWVLQLWKRPEEADECLSSYRRIDTLGFVIYEGLSKRNPNISVAP